jgi:hypothetical protein
MLLGLFICPKDVAVVDAIEEEKNMLKSYENNCLHGLFLDKPL